MLLESLQISENGRVSRRAVNGELRGFARFLAVVGFDLLSLLLSLVLSSLSSSSLLSSSLSSSSSLLLLLWWWWWWWWW